MTARRRRVTRDAVIVTFALTFGAYEIVLGEGRGSVLTFLLGLLLSPLVLRVDDLRRNGVERRGGKQEVMIDDN